MGIPSYYRYLIREYNDIVFDIKNGKYYFNHIDRLFLDLNCAIHPCAQKVMKDVEYIPSKRNSFEKKIINETIDYIIKLVEVVKPKELLYISIDGVAPRAKMEQQRQRRFKSIKEKNEIYKIKSKYQNSENKHSWDKNAITPGTTFMHKLNNELKHFIMYNKLFENLKVILSSSNVPGEGEHKILGHIKETKNNYVDAIYGLDADLIMLSMVTHKPNIYLLREALHFGKGIDVKDVDFLYLNIDKLREYLIIELSKNIEGNFNSREFKENLLSDYIFICFLAGNDFIPHSPAISIKDKGLEMLMELYTKIYNKYGEHLTQKKKINHRFLKELFRELLNIEEDIFISIRNKRSKYYVNLNRCETPEERELEEYNRFPMFHRELERFVKLGDKGWKRRYYEHCFHKKEIDHICKNYLESLVWTYHYYFDSCISWDWYYCFLHSPSFEDVFNYMHKHGDINNHIKFKKSRPYKPFEQLMTVLPSASSHLLPKQYETLINNNDLRIIEYYPTNFRVDTLNCNFMWQCPSILPKIDDKYLLNILREYKHTKDENVRNKNTDIFTNFIQEKNPS